MECAQPLEIAEGLICRSLVAVYILSLATFGSVSVVVNNQHSTWSDRASSTKGQHGLHRIVVNWPLVIRYAIDALDLCCPWQEKKGQI